MKLYLMLLVPTLFIGCTHHHPILSSAQKDKIETHDDYLKDHAKAIYSEINRTNTLGAITVIPSNLSEPPIVLPGNSLIGALVENDINVKKVPSEADRTCYFVYAENGATDPIRMPCKTLLDTTKIITDMKSSYQKFAGGLASAMYLVTFHSAQLEQLEKQFGTVSKALNTNSSAQNQTNQLMKQTIEQIAKSYSDFNVQLSDIIKRIEAIK